MTIVDTIEFDYGNAGVKTSATPQYHWYIDINKKKNRWVNFWDEYTGIDTPRYRLRDRIKFYYTQPPPPGSREALIRASVYSHWYHSHSPADTRAERFWDTWEL